MAQTTTNQSPVREKLGTPDGTYQKKDQIPEEQAMEEKLNDNHKTVSTQELEGQDEEYVVKAGRG